MRSVKKGLLPVIVASMLPAAVTAQTLEESIVSSLKNNPEIGIALNRSLARQESIGVARSGNLPSIDLQAGYGYENSDNSTTRVTGDHSKDLTRQELSVNLRQMLFDGFRTDSDVKRASAEALADQYQLQNTAENLALRAVEVYLESLNAEKIKALSEKNLASHEKIRDQIQLRTESGIGSSSDLSQVEGRLARANSNLVAADNNIQDAVANFFRVVGETPHQLEPLDTLSAQLPEGVVQAEETALSKHPVILAAIEDVRATAEKVRFEESANYPQVSFELGASANHDLDGSEAHESDLTAMFRVNYNLYSGGRIKHSVQQASAEQAQAKDVQRNASRQIVEGLNLAWNAYRALSDQLKYLDIHVEESRKTLTAYTKQFELGRRSLMDLLDTENELFEAEKAFLNAEKDWIFAQYRVLNATGQLLSALEIDHSVQ
ncbi:TolC family outer membrane protein [Motiliproteus sp. MSK22-1]|uniref:TolC family outer membrane protein n=1 Tax=Motiliproteus sp. MSK22-1 TaxID=1897630 RepID=UPI00097593D6|nr:TolC family outer membrane protein [Motiliproteus sp. MSK22-1]OMH38787.1 hypothetical protein BGP75_06325 [Motiliproteus sp. MSK22-1]